MHDVQRMDRGAAGIQVQAVRSELVAFLWVDGAGTRGIGGRVEPLAGVRRREQHARRPLADADELDAPAGLVARRDYPVGFGDDGQILGTDDAANEPQLSDRLAVALRRRRGRLRCRQRRRFLRGGRRRPSARGGQQHQQSHSRPVSHCSTSTGFIVRARSRRRRRSRESRRRAPLPATRSPPAHRTSRSPDSGRRPVPAAAPVGEVASEFAGGAR